MAEEIDQTKFSEKGIAMIKLLSRTKGGIRYGRKSGIKTCAEVGRKKVNYFRGEDVSWTMEECWATHSVYRRTCGELLGKKADELPKIDSEITEKVMEKLLKEKIVTKAK